MAIVAVAGGTGGIGKSVLEHLQHHGSHHKVFVLGRKTPTEPLPGSPTFLEVNYADVSSLVTTLQDYAIDTVISTINLETDAGSQSQLNLIAAADKCQTTRRFIPSEFVSQLDEDDANSGPGIGGWIPNARALKKTSLEYIRISIGFFSDYWGMPHIKSNLKPFPFFIDVENGKAVVPGTGQDKFTVTYSEDLARMIVRLLDAEDKWPPVAFLSGSDIFLNEVIASVEKARGYKIDVTYDPAEKLAKGEVTLLSPSEEVNEGEFKTLLAGVCQMIISGACVLPDDDRRLSKMFPEIPLTSAEDVIAKAWTGK
ncbi:NmrA domain-containing protein [Fusarium falciforme]|uniref:NmrA domain-containing protein n=1 Tax=Fusarium falciforme TaxID=195108 RepID=UPI002301D07F|nr:NmrA domain-containing protein [Fusarium falciforme]WAO96127.1 NmrA domain-containing protein [Fusarium falciforme]